MICDHSQHIGAGLSPRVARSVEVMRLRGLERVYRKGLLAARDPQWAALLRKAVMVTQWELEAHS